jgi:Tfp pilus assembly protein FimT
MRKNSGVTLIELLVVLGIMVFLFVLSFSALVSFRKGVSLSNITQEILNNFRLVQSKTIASEGASQYGIYFDVLSSPQRYIIFKGTNYTSRDVSFDNINNIPNDLELYNVSFNGDSEVVFEKVTGMTDQTGSVSLRSKTNPGKNTTIYIEGSGRVGLDPPVILNNGRISDSRHVHFDYSRAIDLNIETISLVFDGSVTQNIPIITNMKGGQIYWEGEVNVAGTPQKIMIHTHRLNNSDTQFCLHRDVRFNNTTLVITISGDSSGNLINYSADGQTINHSSIYVQNAIRQ